VTLGAQLAALQADVLPALEAVNCPAFLVDPDGNHLWSNAAALELFGSSYRRDPLENVAPEYRPKALHQLTRKRRGTEVTDFELDMIDRRGARVPVLVSSVALRSGDRMVGAFGIVRPLAEPLRAAPPPRAHHLTPRQYEVLTLLDQGRSTHGIAEHLGLSLETVRNHVRAVLRAFGVHSRLQAVAAARDAGLL
jgi:DNA-binding CsgD family transcriptional regulator